MVTLGAKRVLVIEDDDTVLALIRAALESEGFEAACYADCDLGVTAALERAPDLVILDLTSSHRGLMNESAYRGLRSHPSTARVPVILCTGRRDNTIRRTLDELPPFVVYKPFRVADLVRIVREALGAGPA